MGNRRNEMPSWLKIAFFAGVVIFLASILALTAISFLSACGKLDNEKIGSAIDISFGISLLIGLLGIAFSLVLATPHFIMDNKIEAVVREVVKQKFEPDLLNRSEEVIKLDAHLSRMIAFTLLEQEYYAWAIGWSFRALKRYTELNSEYTELYREFHDFVFKQIISKALNAIASGEKDAAEEFGKEEGYKITLRAAKDYVDFRYEIQTYDSKEHVRAIRHDFHTVIDEISRKMQTVIVSLYENCALEDFETNVDGFFFRASRYKQDGDKLRNFFYKNIWVELAFENSPSLAKSEKFQKYCKPILRKYGLAK